MLLTGREHNSRIPSRQKRCSIPQDRREQTGYTIKGQSGTHAPTAKVDEATAVIWCVILWFATSGHASESAESAIGFGGKLQRHQIANHRLAFADSSHTRLNRRLRVLRRNRARSPCPRTPEMLLEITNTVGTSPLLQLRILRLGLLQDGDVLVGVFPEGACL
jgi:hypothetical protein